ncbi:hypothetical protein GSU69_04015 [Rathayibacter festucae]|uniref:Gram-positive cocci surface proteins LPxTG domain-containing protein n=1 Tax=Rathayibacter festucae TaxID=110937 RepID=A0ABX6GWN4_9MICO|nr:hypothetical protein [Rathayibacter festucae]QHC61939.1 hypothetical protein GSU69_04015 [Rathayibacter festucae]
MSLRGTPLRSRSRLACLTLAVGLAAGLLAPGAAASARVEPTPSASPAAESAAAQSAEPAPTTAPTTAPSSAPAATAVPSPAPVASDDTDPSCPDGERAVAIDFDAITVDWTAAPGFATVALPEASFPDCAASADIVLVAEGPDGEYSGGIGVTVPVERDGSAPQTALVPAPAGPRTVLVTTKLYGLRGGSFIDLASEQWRSAAGTALDPSTADTAVSLDGEISIATAPGKLTLSVPPRASTGRYDEANIGYFVTQDNGVGVALDTVEQVPAEGLPARTIEVALPYTADWTVSVQTSGVNEGVEIFRSEILRETLRVQSAFDSCADGLDRSQANEPFTVDAVGGVGTIAVTVGALALPDCFDEVTLRVLVKKFNNDDEQEGVELGPLQSDATFDGATVRGSFAPGRYFVVVLVSAAVDGEYDGLFQVFDPSVNIADDQREPIVVTAAAASTATATGGRHLAATGVETAGAASGAAALLALGLVSLVAARRRRSAQQS